MQIPSFPTRAAPDTATGQSVEFREILRLSLEGLLPAQGALSQLLDRLETRQ